jgi:hypothetical protein
MFGKIKTAVSDMQGVALFLVIFGTAATAAGCKFQWGELKTLGASVAGAGIQAITTQIRSAFASKTTDSGDGSSGVASATAVAS